MSTFGVVRFREPFLFLFAGREVRLPSRRRALLAWGSGDCLDLFFLRLLLLPIASLFAFGHVNLLWLMNRYHSPSNVFALMRGTDRSSKSRGKVPCLDPDLAPVPASSCAQISIRGEPEPRFSLKLVPTFVKAPFEHEKFSAAFQIKFDRGTRSPTLQPYALAFVRKQFHGLHTLAVWV